MVKRTQKASQIALALVTLALAVAACSGGGDAVDGGSREGVVVTVTLSEFMVGTDFLNVPTGVPVTFNVVNDGAVEHELVLEADGADREPLAAGTLAENIGPGQTGSFSFTFEEGGTVQLACHIPGHFEAGMTTSLNVEG